MFTRMRWWPREDLTLVSPLTLDECVRGIARLVGAAPAVRARAAERDEAPPPGAPRAARGEPTPAPFEGTVDGRRFRIRRRVRFQILRERPQPWVEGQVEPGSGESVIHARVRHPATYLVPWLLLVAVFAVPALLLLASGVAMCVAAVWLGPSAPWGCAPDVVSFRMFIVPATLATIVYAGVLAWFDHEVKRALRLLAPVATPARQPGRSLVRG